MNLTMEVFPVYLISIDMNTINEQSFEDNSFLTKKKHFDEKTKIAKVVDHSGEYFEYKFEKNKHVIVRSSKDKYIVVPIEEFRLTYDDSGLRL